MIDKTGNWIYVQTFSAGEMILHVPSGTCISKNLNDEVGLDHVTPDGGRDTPDLATGEFERMKESIFEVDPTIIPGGVPEYPETPPEHLPGYVFTDKLPVNEWPSHVGIHQLRAGYVRIRSDFPDNKYPLHFLNSGGELVPWNNPAIITSNTDAKRILPKQGKIIMVWAPSAQSDPWFFGGNEYPLDFSYTPFAFHMGGGTRAWVVLKEQIIDGKILSSLTDAPMLFLPTGFSDIGAINPEGRF